MLEHDIGEIAAGSNPQWQTGGRFKSVNGDAADGDHGCAGDNILKARLREELLLQARAGLPITYTALAERLGGSGATGAFRSSLEGLMDDDASEGRPLLAAVIVETLEPGLPRPWFFRKAESLGLFAGHPSDVEAYAFHAKEFHRVTRLHARSPFDDHGSGRALRRGLAVAGSAPRAL